MRSDFGVFIARAIAGAAIAAHGAQKAFGTFNGPGPEAAAGFMQSLGFEEGDRAAQAAAYAELASGGLIATGFLGPVGPALLISTMIVAMETVHIDNGFFVSDNGVEVPLLYATLALALAGTGYGKCSLDTMLGLDGFFSKRRLFYTSMIGAVAGAVWVLSQRTPPAEPDGGGESHPVESAPENDRTAA